MYENVKYDLIAEPIEETSEAALEGKQSDSQAFSFDSVFKYEDEVNASNYRSVANFSSAFKYSESAPPGTYTSPSAPLDISYGPNRDLTYEQRRQSPSFIMMIICHVLTILSYVFFLLTLPIT